MYIKMINIIIQEMISVASSHTQTDSISYVSSVAFMSLGTASVEKWL